MIYRQGKIYTALFTLAAVSVLLSGCKHVTEVPSETVAHDNQQLYINEDYGFALQYPEGWRINEQSTINIYDPEVIAVSYRDALTIEFTQQDFESLKNSIEQTDILPSGESLARFSDITENQSIDGHIATVGTHATAIGPTIKYYFIPLQEGALYIEFYEPTATLNTKVEKVIQSIHFSDTIDKTNWLTYTDGSGISFQYPESYTVYPPHRGVEKLDEKNIIVGIQFKYDLPKYESQFLGMAKNVASQESFDTYVQKMLTDSSNVTILPNGYQTNLYIGGNENSNLIKEYTILQDDYLVTLTASASTYLSNLGKEREHYGDDGTLSDQTPTEITEYFKTFDDIVATLDLNHLVPHEGNQNFEAAASIDMGQTVFDDCGNTDKYQNSSWFQHLIDNLQTNEIASSEIAEICFSDSEQIAIILAGAKYCGAGHLFNYDIRNDELNEAERLNHFLDCPTAPTSFGDRTGQIIEMKGVSGDGGCGSYRTFQYNYISNKYRMTHAKSICDGDDDYTEIDY